MTKERLELLSDEILKKVAENFGLKKNSEKDRDQIMSELIEILEEERVEKETLLNLAQSIEAKKYSVSIDEELDLSYDVDEEMFLPERYNETMVHLVLRDNSWGLILWDIHDSTNQKLINDLGQIKYILRVVELNSSEYSKDAVTDTFDIEVKYDERKRYISLPHEESYYCIDLVVCTDLDEIFIERSEIVKTSRDHVNYIPGVNDNLCEIVKLSGYPLCEDEDCSRRSLNRILSLDSFGEEN